MQASGAFTVQRQVGLQLRPLHFESEVVLPLHFSPQLQSSIEYCQSYHSQHAYSWAGPCNQIDTLWTICCSPFDSFYNSTQLDLQEDPFRRLPCRCLHVIQHLDWLCSNLWSLLLWGPYQGSQWVYGLLSIQGAQSMAGCAHQVSRTWDKSSLAFFTAFSVFFLGFSQLPSFCISFQFCLLLKLYCYEDFVLHLLVLYWSLLANPKGYRESLLLHTMLSKGYRRGKRPRHCWKALHMKSKIQAKYNRWRGEYFFLVHPEHRVL